MGADSTDVTEANPLWRFSLALYEQDGIAEACIALQDGVGLDVNLLLYSCFATACGMPLAAADIAAVDAAVTDWRERIVQPLRALRREAGEGLRGKLLEAELLAERGQQALMWQARSPLGDWPPPAGGTDLLRPNLAALAVVGDIDGQRLALFEALAEGVMPRLSAQL